MKLLLSFSMSFFLLSVICVGQKESIENRKIHLKDGTVLVGKVIEDNDFHVKIVIETGDTLTVGYKNIRAEGSVRSKVKKERTYTSDAYFFGLGIVGHFGNSSASEVFGQVGKRMSERLNLGIQLSFYQRDDFISNLLVNQDLLNIGLYSRYYLTSKKPKIFVDGSFGYGFNTSNNINFGRPTDDTKVNGGIQGRASAGIHFASREKVRWLMNFGVSINKASGNITGIDPFNGEIRTIFSKEYTSPFLGFMIEF